MSELINTAPGEMTAAATEMRQAIETAKRYPRDLATFQDRAEAMALHTPAIAAQMYYAIKRDGKVIEGPSTRLAEVVAACWGNIRSKAEIIETTDRTITARGYCIDLENNVAVSTDVTKRITTKNGKRYGDDMIATTSNAACSTALRNAIFKVVPKAYVEPLVDRAKDAAGGRVKSLVASRQAMLEHFRKLGVEPEQVAKYCEKVSVEQIDIDDLATLRGIANSLKEGDKTIEDIFPPDLPPDLDRDWFRHAIAECETPLSIDRIRDECIALHPNDKQWIWDQAEARRDAIVT